MPTPTLNPTKTRGVSLLDLAIYLADATEATLDGRITFSDRRDFVWEALVLSETANVLPELDAPLRREIEQLIVRAMTVQHDFDRECWSKNLDADHPTFPESSLWENPSEQRLSIGEELSKYGAWH